MASPQPRTRDNNFTISADINTNKGLEFDGDQTAVKLGVGLAFNGSTGAIDSQAQALIYRGVVDLTADGNVPANPVGGDTYANTVDGSISTDWRGCNWQKPQAPLWSLATWWSGTEPSGRTSQPAALLERPTSAASR